MNFDGIAVSDYIDISALRTALQRGQWNEAEVVSGVYKKMSVDELVGKETAVFVVEDRFELVGAGGDIDLIIDGEELAAGNFVGVVAIESFDGQVGIPFAKFIENLRKLILWKSEDHGDGLNFGNDQEPVAVGSVDDVAGIDEAETDTSGNGSGDAGVGQLKLCVIDLRLIGLDRSVELADGGALRIELLFWDNAFLIQQLETFQIHLGVFALSDIFGQLALGLFELHLKRTRIDFGKEIANFYKLAFFKGDVDELAINPAADGDGVERSNSAKAVEVNGKIAFGRGSDNNGNAEISRRERSASLGLTGSACGGGVLG